MNVFRHIATAQFPLAGRSPAACPALLLLLFLLPAAARAAGLLTPVATTDQPALLESHHVRVVINNGFARTEVEQVFFNPNPRAIEAIYAVPVPDAGALSELTIWTGEKTLQGEVVAKEEAERIYQQEKAAGREAAKADKQSYQRFEFAVYPVPAEGVVRARYAYYEPLILDTGVGRYSYRLEEGGTDEQAAAFWSLDDRVASELSIEVILKSAWPVEKTRAPNFAGTVEKLDDRVLRYRFDSSGPAHLDQDFVFYYMLEKNLPGRLELVTYRESDDRPGTFMMLLTPGADLRPLEEGSDYVFALDVSGSMQGKLSTLVAGVKKALVNLEPRDRFRIVAFNNQAWMLFPQWLSATAENVERAIEEVERLAPSGGTNVYAGVELGLKRLDADRVSTMLLVTDGVANQGIVDPRAFYKLLHRQDLRFFGFLLGNSSDWPLMSLMCEASGGHYRAVSNADDIIGEIMLAKGRIAHQSLRDASLSIKGVRAFDISSFSLGKIHYGQQLALFGRYESGGLAEVTLRARIGGEEQVYSGAVEFPHLAEAHPELERLWAMDQIRRIELDRTIGRSSAVESKQAVRDLGISYQLVTDETSLIALEANGFARHGLERRNERRLAKERAAALAHAKSPGALRADTARPAFNRPAPSYGGGALEPWMALGLAAGGLAWVATQRLRKGAVASARGTLLLATLALFVAAFDAAAQDPGRAAYPCWTERIDSRPVRTGSIDDSIASFWEVSEQAAWVEPRTAREPEALPAPDRRLGSHVESRSARRTGGDEHALRQSRDRRSGSGHFGINLFNAIPLIDFVWGSRNEDEREEYRGSLRR